VILVEYRLGIGFDIEYNETLCHILADDDSDSEAVVGYNGILIKIPFFSIYLGDFFTLDFTNSASQE
jgi:hypothetical protein